MDVTDMSLSALKDEHGLLTVDIDRLKRQARELQDRLNRLEDRRAVVHEEIGIREHRERQKQR